MYVVKLRTALVLVRMEKYAQIRWKERDEMRAGISSYTVFADVLVTLNRVRVCGMCMDNDTHSRSGNDILNKYRSCVYAFSAIQNAFELKACNEM